MTTSTDSPIVTPAKGQAPRAGEAILNSTELAHKIVDLADEKQAVEITLLDLSKVTVLADYFVICTADSSRQTMAILDSVAVELKKLGVLPLHPAEGDPTAGWTLLDYGDVVVHVFDAPTRTFYNLEQLWKDAPVVLKMQ
ncbi:MAG: ribosome silencing factor [Anaerolineae bacterium]